MPIVPPTRLLATAALLLGTLGAAQAHPHVWITARAEITYEAGRIAGVRHAWTFDAAYSAYVTQGLDTNGDGKLAPDELQSLANENTTNLAEFAYFTKLKVTGKEQPFGDPRDAHMQMEGDKLTLSFLLPLKAAVAQGKGVAAVEVYDPTAFVSFSFSDGPEAAKLVGAPPGCAVSLTRPKAAETQTADAGKPMSEAFFEALTAASSFGAQFANRVIVACP